MVQDARLNNTLNQLTVLYVEDEAGVREQFQQFLNRRVGTLISAEDGVSGLEAFQLHHPDVVITDIQMPNLDGIAMSHQIRAINPNIPIIFTTAFEDSRYLKAAIDIGINKYLTKPLDTDLLLQSLKQCASRLQLDEIVSNNNQHLQTILDNLFAYVALLDPHGVVLEVNKAPLQRGGYRRDDVIGQFFYDAPWWAYDEKVRSRLLQAIDDACQGKTTRYDVTVKMGEEFVPIDFQIAPILDPNGQVIALLPTAVDITQRKQVEDRLAVSEEQYRLVLDGSELGYWDWNIVSNEVERNERWALMLGYSHEEIIHSPQQWTDFIHPDDRERAWKSINDVLEGQSAAHKIEYRMLHKDGSLRWILDLAKVVQFDDKGKPIRMSGTHTDITERKRLELELERQAHFDYLTGLYNRGHFIEKAELELARAIRYENPLSILMMDIDHFKQINDSYGHKVGDLVLQKLSESCRAILREVDIVGRLGGEEFAIILPETAAEESQEVADRLRIQLASTPVSIDGGKLVRFTVSIGGVALTTKVDNLDQLMSQADIALYDAKNAGRNKVIFHH